MLNIKTVIIIVFKLLKRKTIAIIIISILSASIGSTIVINEFYLKEDKTIPPTPEPQPEIFENPLEGVPYVGQETSSFCAYASITSYLQYLDFDVDLEEILFYFGLGFSAYYESGESYFTFLNGVLFTQYPENFNFVTSLFGVTFDMWTPENNLDDHEMWNQYWTQLKDNISNGYPVITSVDPFSLPSFRMQFDLPDNILDSIPPFAHSIIIVGYDEITQSVCYNDPSTDYYGNPEDGYYVWMTIDELKTAISKSIATKYLIGRCIKVADPLTKEERYYKACNINIEKLKGNPSAYFIDDDDLSLGINAAKDLKKHFEGGILNRIKTKNLLKKTGWNYRRVLLNNWFQALKLKISFKELKSLIIADSPFKLIASEKQYIADYLRTINFDNNAYKIADLLEEEANNWLKIDKNFNKFLERGFLIGPLRGIFSIRTMEKTLDDIIQIEENIINLY